VQNKHQIKFEIQKLRGPERLYSIYDKEVLTIMLALVKFIQYLVGGIFVVRTDHNNL
jgi:hypothetical protein